jgi:hypothetical protein
MVVVHGQMGLYLIHRFNGIQEGIFENACLS